MHPNNKYVPSKYSDVGRGLNYNKKGTFWYLKLPQPPPPYVSHPAKVVSLRLYFDATSQVSWEARDVTPKSFELGLVGTNAILNQ